MCFDNEETQAPSDNRVLRDKLREANLQEQLNRSGILGGGSVTNQARPYSDSEIVAELFKYHPPTIEQIPRYSAINQAAKNFAEIILENCPASADRSAAIRLLRDARMTANAAIALNGLSL